MQKSSSSQHVPVIPSSAAMCPDRQPCRFCGEPLDQVVVDLGLQPLCQSRVLPGDLNKPETFYPLRAYVCHRCWLVQVHAHVGGEQIFSEYAYFSSYSDTMLQHSRDYVAMIRQRLHLGPEHFAVELASNDGYLLQYFLQEKIPCLGVEPAANVAAAAQAKGIDCLVEFFGEATAKSMIRHFPRPDLVIANNVYAHVPNLNDFTRGLKILLHDRGVITIEVSHLMKILEHNLFDTIYQEHFFYYSVGTIAEIFAAHGLKLFDVESLPTQGGSLRVYGCHQEDASKSVSDAVHKLIDEEQGKGYRTPEPYQQFAARVAATKRQLLSLLISAKDSGKRICAYGAPGKGNTLLNYCGIREDFIDFTVDRNPVKQNTCLVGSRIPVYAPEMIAQARPDFVLILPWNLEAEITQQLSYIQQWGGKFIVPLPIPRVVDAFDRSTAAKVSAS